MSNAQTDEVVFIRDVGFRLARGGLVSSNVVVARGPETLTAQLTSDRDGSELRVTIDGVSEELEFRKGRAVDAPVEVVDDHGHVVAQRPSKYMPESSFFRLMDGPTKFMRNVTLDRLAADVRAVRFVMTGGAGDWDVTIPVEPHDASGPRGTPCDARALAHDIELWVSCVARTSTMLAVEIESRDLLRPASQSAHEAQRWIEGIGTFDHFRVMGQDVLMLRDSTGEHQLERPRAVQDHPGRGRRREVAMFGPVSADAVSASIEIPFISVRERCAEIRVPVPGETEVVMNHARARVTTSRVTRSSDSTDARPSPVEGLNGACVRIVMVPLDTDAERQLVMAGVMESNDRGMSVSRSRADPPVMEVPDPSGSAEFMTLASPLIRLAGPWRLDFPLPPIED